MQVSLALKSMFVSMFVGWLSGYTLGLCHRSPRWLEGCDPFLFPLDLARTPPSSSWIPIAFSQSPLDLTRNPPLLIGVLERLHLFLLDGLWLQRSVKCVCSGAAVWLHNLANKISNFYWWNILLLAKFFCREVTFWTLYAYPVYFLLRKWCQNSPIQDCHHWTVDIKF